MKNYAILVTVVSSIVLMISVILCIGFIWDMSFVNKKQELSYYDNDQDYKYHEQEKCRNSFSYANSPSDLLVNSCIDSIDLTRRDKDKQKYIDKAVEDSYLNMVKSGIWSFISMIFLLFHWKLLKKYSNNV